VPGGRLAAKARTAAACALASKLPKRVISAGLARAKGVARALLTARGRRPTLEAF